MQQQKPSDAVTMRGSFNLFFFVALIHTRCVTPFLRRRVGCRSQGWLSILAGVFMYYLAHGQGDPKLLMYVWVWTGASIFQRATADRNVHSRYEGASVVWFVSEGLAKFVIEPLVCVGIGYFLLPVSDVLGKLIMSSALSLMFLDRLAQQGHERRVQEVIDAQIEAQYLSDGVRRRF